MLRCCHGCCCSMAAAMAPSPIQAPSLLHLGPHAPHWATPSRSLPHLPPPSLPPGSDTLTWITRTPRPPPHPTQAPFPLSRPLFPHLHRPHSACLWHPVPGTHLCGSFLTLLSCLILQWTMSLWKRSFLHHVQSCFHGCLLTPLECWHPILACLPVWTLISLWSYCLLLWAPVALLCWGGHPPR